jgi:hypothetical protein
MSDPRNGVSGPGPEGIHPTLRTGPLTTGPEGPPEDQARTKDHSWQERLQALVDEAVRKRQAKADQREQFARSRAHGLQQRHAAKLARNRRPPDKP